MSLNNVIIYTYNVFISGRHLENKQVKTPSKGNVVVNYSIPSGGMGNKYKSTHNIKCLQLVNHRSRGGGDSY